MKIKDLDTKTKIIIAIAVAIMLVIVIVYFIKVNTPNNQDELFENEENSEVIENNEKIMVHVAGEVKYQGVVILKEGQRVVDAIEAAGGETENADLNKLNLAYVLTDGEKLYVPNKEDENKEYVMTGNGEEKEDGLININVATVEDLQKLPGIGESLAERIVMYRTQNGKFNSIEDIKNVTGIGENKFANIKDLIKI